MNSKFLISPMSDTNEFLLDAAVSESSEMYSYPESHQFTTTPCLSLREMDFLDKKTVNNPKSRLVDLKEERNMTPNTTAMVDRLLKEIIWMCDVILETANSDGLWLQYFKTQLHKPSIRGIYADVRSLTWSLINRESPDAAKPIFTKRRLKILVVHSACQVEPINRMADVCMVSHTITLYKSFMDGWNSWDGLHKKEILENVCDSGGLPEPKHLYSTRAGTLLHELVHYVSLVRWKTFCSRLQSRQALWHMAWRRYRYITDIDPAIYALKHSKGDKQVLQTFESRKWTTKWGSKGTAALSAYGLGATEHLAKLERGGLATMLNADNYLAYGAAMCAELLREELKKGKATVEQILSTKPTR